MSPYRGMCRVVAVALVLGVACNGPRSVQSVARKIRSSVVLIVGTDELGQTVPVGTGFFISGKGCVATNHHVWVAASEPRVKAADSTIYSISQVLFLDEDADLAVLQTDAPPARSFPLVLARTRPQPGEAVVVVGSPLGLEQTVTEGIVSAVRDVPEADLHGVIQISAPISPGSSGSPVVNMRGQVIGIATFQSTFGQNLNFAMPVAKLEPYAQRGPVAGGPTARTERSARAESLLSVGTEMMQSGRHAGALPVLQQSARLNRRDARVHWCLGECYLTLNLLREALRSYTTATKVRPDYGEAFLGVGVCYTRRREYRRALKPLQRATSLLPQSPEAHYYLGLAYAGAKKDLQAQSELEILDNLSPQLAEELRDQMSQINHH